MVMLVVVVNSHYYPDTNQSTIVAKDAAVVVGREGRLCFTFR